jgi:hypothetical protein
VSRKNAPHFAQSVSWPVNMRVFRQQAEHETPSAKRSLMPLQF